MNVGGPSLGWPRVPGEAGSDKQMNAAIGDKLMLPKNPKHTRFYIQNPRGLSLGATGSLPTKLDHVSKMQVDCVQFSGHDLDTTKKWVVNAIHKEAKNTFGYDNYKLVVASSEIKSHTSHKVGGTMALVTGDLMGRVREVGADRMGRWVYIKFAGRQGKIITVITTYQVCDEKVKDADKGSFITQQFSMLVQEGRQNPQRVRDHHAKDLIEFIKTCQTKGELIQVGGDFNESIGIDNTGMTKLCSQCDLEDVIFDKHKTVGFATRHPGSRIIDYVLMDTELLDAVKRCGYEPFNAHIFSDHRGMYIDVDTIEFFGSDTLPLPKLAHRGVSSKKIHLIAPYFEKATAQLQLHKWNESVKQLQECIDNNEPNHLLAERVDVRRTRALIYAEKQLKTYPRAPYSPAIIRLRNINMLLQLMISDYTSEYDLSDALQRRKDDISSLDFTPPTTLAECKRMQRENWKVLLATERDEIKTAKLRVEHQLQLVAQYEATGDKEAAKRIKRIKNAEATMRVWRKCAAARGLANKGGIDHLLVPSQVNANPNTCNNWRTIDDSDELMAVLLKHIQDHFGQAKNCKLTSPPLDITNDFEGACHKAEALLNGTYDTSAFDPAVKWLLDNLQYVTTMNVVSEQMTEEEFKGKIMSWKERTSTSAGSKMHLGHAKMYYARHTLPVDSAEAERLEQQRQDIIKGHLTCINYCLKFGYSHVRWQDILNSIMAKIAGLPYRHKLRVIHIFEWDLNLLLSTKWRNLLHHVCDKQLINASCYGSMPGRSSLNPVLLKEIEYELCRLTRIPLVEFDSDTTACYDRIPCFLANVTSRKYGQNVQACIVQGRTLAQAKYYVKTKFKISEESISHSQEFPFFGPGQGAGNASTYWLLISSTLFDIYNDKAQGATYESPDKSLSMKLSIVGFVDDTTGRTNNFTKAIQPPMSELIANASSDGQLWHDLLSASNQSLQLSKCGFRPIQYQFEPSGEPVLDLSPEAPDPLLINDDNGTPVAIPYIACDKAERYLGCHKTIANQKEQQHKLQERCNDYAKVVNTSPLERIEATQFYHAIYLLSCGYPLPMCYFTKQELDTIQSKAHHAFLAKRGYNTHTATAIVFGHQDYGGADFNHLYDLQGIGQIETFMKFWRSPQETPGQLLRIMVHWAQYCAGTSWSILMDTETELPHLETKWLSALREYLQKVQGQLELKDSGIPPTQRIGDSHIMDHVINSGKFEPKQIKRINWCRMYLGGGIVTVADIANANGDYIDHDMYIGNPRTTSKWHRVVQKRPDSGSWKQWKRALKLFSTQKEQKLHEPLGNWTVPRDEIRQPWRFWHDDMNALYQKQENGFRKHKKMQFDFDKLDYSEVAELPAEAVPIDVVERTYTLQAMNNYVEWSIDDSSVELTRPYIIEAFQTLDEWEWQLLKHVQLRVPEQELMHILNRNHFIIATDGSATKHLGSFGWILSTKKGQRLATCYGPSYGGKKVSFRSEGYGILSGTCFLQRLRQRHNCNDKWKGVMVCDNKSMVDKVKDPPPKTRRYNNATMHPDWDVIAEAWRVREELDNRCKLKLQHIKGHQDRKKPYRELSIKAQLNVDADRLAEQYIQDHPDEDTSRAPIFPTSGIQLHLEHGTVTFKHKRDIRKARTLPDLKKHHCERYQWTEETFNDVDWETLRQAMNRNCYHRTTLTKMIHGIAPVGKMVNNYGKQYALQCISCGEPIETQEHIYQCPCNTRKQWRGEFLSDMRELMTKLNTHLDLMSLMMEALHALVKGHQPHTIAVPEGLEQLAMAQSDIGWDQIIKGRLSVAWKEAQQQHLESTKTISDKNNGQTWATAIIDQIFKHWWKLWEMRNKERHGHDIRTRAQAANRQALHEMKLLYEYKDTISEKYKWILEPTLDSRQHWPTKQLRAWINSYGPIIEKDYNDRYKTR